MQSWANKISNTYYWSIFCKLLRGVTYLDSTDWWYLLRRRNVIIWAESLFPTQSHGDLSSISSAQGDSLTELALSPCLIYTQQHISMPRPRLSHHHQYRGILISTFQTNNIYLNIYPPWLNDIKFNINDYSWYLNIPRKKRHLWRLSRIQSA